VVSPCCGHRWSYKRCDVRWNSKYDAVVYYNKHWGKLVEICAHHAMPRECVRQHIENVMIRRTGEELQMIYQPVAVMLDRLQRDDRSWGPPSRLGLLFTSMNRIMPPLEEDDC
jgi:hypothetical protein